MSDDTFEPRAEYSENRLKDLAETVRKIIPPGALEGLTIFTAGSYARLEASEHSDIDLFFVYHPSGRNLDNRRTDELKLFGQLIQIVKDKGYPPFSNDSEYLRTHNTHEILDQLGGRHDDYYNHFTLRMLLLLESKCVFGEPQYQAGIKEIIHSYYRDYPNHQDAFRPRFLMNDIMRFWNTLLLNYENKRTRAKDPDDVSQRVKNFKLKFSRMTTCFATLAVLGSHEGPISEDQIFEMVTMTPRARLLRTAEQLPETIEVIGILLDDYAWFIDLTGLTKAELHQKFADSEDRRQMFARADGYGAKMYELLSKIDEHRPGFMRDLVI
ncbi:MAG TPA: nucleotidyltransferase domain-containing protein [Steroidobacteraceae bacterium]|jgi:predicted nucleotidyltransferase